MSTPNEIVLVRHGATEWSTSKQHTGRTDIPLTDAGRAEARALGDRLRGRDFSLVLVSPLRRARETAVICGFDDAHVDDDLREWDYGEYEGRTTADVREEVPGWTVWNGPTPGAESVEDVGVRADRVLTRLQDVAGDAAVFSHGHFLRVLGARWLGLPPVDGRLFALHTATLSVLGYERETRVLHRWNA